MVKIYKCHINIFPEIYRNKDIICFGAGEELLKICSKYDGISKRIKCIVDNNKSGQNIVINDIFIPIVLPEEIFIQKGKQIGIVSTICYADQIIKQLDSIKRYNGFPLFMPYFFDENDKEFNSSIICTKEIIPKIIHYCWFGNKEMPDQFKKNIDSWKKYCPDYEFIRWDEHNYDIKKNRYMEQAYHAKKWGFVPDYARLDIINTYGGIYLDTDVEILRSWDGLLGHKLFCGFESDEFIAFGLGFGGVSNNKILEEMMIHYNDLCFYNDDGSLNLTASPVYQTEIMKRHGLVCNGEMQITDEYAVYPTQYFAPISPLGKGKVSRLSYSIHQYAASWFGQDDLKKRNRTIESIQFAKTRIEEFNQNLLLS